MTALTVLRGNGRDGSTEHAETLRGLAVRILLVVLILPCAEGGAHDERIAVVLGRLGILLLDRLRGLSLHGLGRLSRDRAVGAVFGSRAILTVGRSRLGLRSLRLGCGRRCGTACRRGCEIRSRCSVGGRRIRYRRDRLGLCILSLRILSLRILSLRSRRGFDMLRGLRIILDVRGVLLFSHVRSLEG